MKVLVIGSRVPFPLRDGGAIATYNLLKGLSSVGVEVDFLTLNTHKHFVDETHLKKHFGFLHEIKTFYIDTRVRPFPALLNLFGRSSYNIDRFIDEGFRQMIQEQCRRNSYDIIHFEGLFTADYVKGLECPGVKVMRQHNIEYKIWKTLENSLSIGAKRWYMGFLAKRLERYEKQIHKYFDAVVSITENDRSDTVDELKYSGRTVYIPAGIDIEEVRSKVDYKSVYHIGSMEWIPNQEAMKWFHDEVWRILSKKDSSIHFYMGGKHMPDFFKSYQQVNFNVLGEIKDLGEFTADKSILVVPLKSGSGIRIKTLEAMMSGKAVVTTSTGAYGLDIRSEEHCLMADTAEEFADAIIRLGNSPELRNRLAENGRQFALNNFGNEAVSLKWKSFYASLVKSGNS